MFIVRQGDVLIKSVDAIPNNCEEIKPDNNRNILAYGEVTGHAHALPAKKTLLLKAANQIFLVVLKETELTHEEHAPIKLPVGNYEIIRQREYAPGEIHYVAD